jgi:hypothetical protein
MMRWSKVGRSLYLILLVLCWICGYILLYFGGGVGAEGLRLHDTFKFIEYYHLN